MSPDRIEKSAIDLKDERAVAEVLSASDALEMIQNLQKEPSTRRSMSTFSTADSGPYANVIDGHEMSW